MRRGSRAGLAGGDLTASFFCGSGCAPETIGPRFWESGEISRLHARDLEAAIFDERRNIPY
jgi:hypothetical protein